LQHRCYHQQKIDEETEDDSGEQASSSPSIIHHGYYHEMYSISTARDDPPSDNTAHLLWLQISCDGPLTTTVIIVCVDYQDLVQEDL